MAEIIPFVPDRGNAREGKKFSSRVLYRVSLRLNIACSPMNVIINNNQQEVTDAASIAEALSIIHITDAQKGIAVAVNDMVIPRTEWTAHQLQPGDKITVIRATQGG